VITLIAIWLSGTMTIKLITPPAQV